MCGLTLLNSECEVIVAAAKHVDGVHASRLLKELYIEKESAGVIGKPVGMGSVNYAGAVKETEGRRGEDDGDAEQSLFLLIYP